jgi:pimeloyl-ACP methyl ester carboxylesterase
MNDATAGVPPLPELRLVGVEPGESGMEGSRLSYMEAGGDRNETVVLLHGIGSNSTGWRYVLAALHERYRVVAWNAPGYYLSDNFSREAPTNVQYADALAALLDALQVDSVHVVGSSFGSLVAATFASRFPDRVRRLVLLGTSRGQKWHPPEERARRLAVRAESIRDGGLALATRRWQNLLAPTASAVAVALTQQVLAATQPRGMMQAARATDTTDVLEFAATITAPTLLAVGTEDRVNPPEISRTIAAAIPKARLVELEGIGHLPKLEAPEQTVRLISGHLST